MALSKSSIYVRLGILGALLTPFLIVVLTLLGYDVKLWGCPLKALVGIPCPTWGMTRAVLAISHTQWAAAIEYHPLAPLVLILWGMATVQISLELITKRPLNQWWQCRRLWFGGLLLMIGYHGYRLHSLWANGTLAVYIRQSLLHSLI